MDANTDKDLPHGAAVGAPWVPDYKNMNSLWALVSPANNPQVGVFKGEGNGEMAINMY